MAKTIKLKEFKQVKIFTGSTTKELEESINTWFKIHSELVRIISFTPLENDALYVVLLAYFIKMEDY